MRIVLGVEYNGSQFCGWQTQPSGCAVQDVIETALSEIAGMKVQTTCAGRTDAGVHALSQVVHFDTPVQRPETAWVRGVNSLLPRGVAVIWTHQTGSEFHARYSALERRYRYVLLNHPVRPAFNQGEVGWTHVPLDLTPMREAVEYLRGEHDFSAFRSSQCQSKSPIRDLRSVEIWKDGDYVIYDLAANAFLHHMVRNIVGSLVQVGAGRRNPQWIAEVLESRDRAMAAPMMDAAGLYLLDVRYDAKWGLTGNARNHWIKTTGG